MTPTTHELQCACCNGIAIATFNGEEFSRGDCANCGPIIRLDLPAYDEIVRRIRAAEVEP